MALITAFDLLAKIVITKNTEALAALNANPEWLQSDNESLACKYISDFYNSYGDLPSHGICIEHIPGFPVVADEPVKFYEDFLRNRALHAHIISTLVYTSDKLKSGDTGLQEARDYLIERVGDLHKKSHHKDIFDYSQMGPDLWKEFTTNRWGIFSGIPLGWEFLDTMSKGVRAGDFNTLVGRPGEGKTQLALYSALTVKNAGHSVLFVSMEMAPILIASRLSAMDTRMNMGHIKSGLTSSAGADKYRGYALGDIAERPGKLHLIHGNLGCRVSEIVSHCRALKPAIVYIDGAYLLKPEKGYQGRDHKVNDLAAMIKSEIASDMNMPVFATYQFNRDGEKARKSGKRMGLEHISWGDAIGQLSSICLGLFQDEEAEVSNHRTVSILKGRSGETGEFKVNWNFETSDFSQVEETEVTYDEQD